MTTHELIKQYARMLHNVTIWKTQADALRDKIARIIEREENFSYNGTRATRYRVKGSQVRAHNRRPYHALRITV